METPYVVCNQALNYDPVVQEVLDLTDGMLDLEAAVNITLEQILRIREEQRNPDTTNRIMVRREGRNYLPLSSQGLTRPMEKYSYFRYDLKQQFYEKQKMLLEALWHAIPPLLGGSDVDNLSVRPNFGAVTVPSVFDGVEVGVFTDVMPWVSRHATVDEIRRFSESYDPSRLAQRGLLPIALEHASYFYEKVGPYGIGIGDIHNQGPMDVAHQIRGEEIFYDLYDDPPFVHELMEMSTSAYLAVTELAEKASGRNDRQIFPYCDDSSVLLSEGLFVEFSLPYLYKVSEPLAGIQVHYCGKGHLDRHYFDCPKVEIINLGQPEYFDCSHYMKRVIEAGKIYAGQWPTLPEEDTARSYFSRLLGPLDRNRQNFRTSIHGYEYGMPSPELCRLWYAMQDELLS